MVRWVEFRPPIAGGRAGSRYRETAVYWTPGETRHTMEATEPRPTDAPSRTLWWLLEGSRGGPARRRLLSQLVARPQNTHQLSKALGLDYKTVAHHLRTLVGHGMLIRSGETYGAVYFVSSTVEAHPEFLQERPPPRNGGRRDK